MLAPVSPIPFAQSRLKLARRETLAANMARKIAGADEDQLLALHVGSAVGRRWIIEWPTDHRALVPGGSCRARMRGILCLSQALGSGNQQRERRGGQMAVLADPDEETRRPPQQGLPGEQGQSGAAHARAGAATRSLTLPECFSRSGARQGVLDLSLPVRRQGVRTLDPTVDCYDWRASWQPVECLWPVAARGGIA